MKRRRVTFGVPVLCTIVLCALAAQSAIAAGTTAFTCSSSAPVKTFQAAHCKPSDTGGTTFGHLAIPKNTSTEVSITDITTGSTHSGVVLKATVAGSAIELVAKEAAGTGTMENNEAGGEQFISASTSSKYSGVRENLLGCKVVGNPGGAGVIETKPLATSTAGQGDAGKLTPKIAGGPFTEFELTECVIGPLTIKVFGSVKCPTEGATVNCVHNTVTAEKTLRLQNATTGPVAGLELSTTFKGRAKSTESFTPLSPTT